MVYFHGAREGASVMQGIRSFFKTYLLWELFQGLWSPGRACFQRKVHGELPEEKTPRARVFAAYTRCAASQRRGAAASL